jgi:hypothetical protein
MLESNNTKNVIVLTAKVDRITKLFGPISNTNLIRLDSSRYSFSTCRVGVGLLSPILALAAPPIPMCPLCTTRPFLSSGNFMLASEGSV